MCELFAGVGGFRCGLNFYKNVESTEKAEKWKTVWFSQWEPSEKTTQYAHQCYVYNFGRCMDIKGEDTTNFNIEDVDKNLIPDFNLLVGGFPCQDYSVASSLATSKGLEGKKGILWWSIREILEIKKPPFVLLENVDRLLKSPASQRGRDFAIMLACFRDEGYIVEWRVINAADYGFQQRRKRIFIFAYKKDTSYAKKIQKLVKYSKNNNETKGLESIKNIMLNSGFFAKSFRVVESEKSVIKTKKINEEIGEISDNFNFLFDNTGIMIDKYIYTLKTKPVSESKQIVLGDVMESGDVDESYFIPEDKLYYTDPKINYSDERIEALSNEKRRTWQYIKGSKKIARKSKDGHEYVFSEGPIEMIDRHDKPARTMLTSEGNFSRTTHIVEDKRTGRIRLLTPTEAERIQGFPTNHTKYCLKGENVIEVPLRKRFFMMGNALVVDLIKQMEKQLSDIFDEEK